ncbi:MAG TPA: radical SAM protein [Acidobacteriaceae bacterium]|nr:radical SAM protein [Acidobacteriaceae bacterium]
MTGNLVRIDHSDPSRADILFVDWLLGNQCNYACSYCPASLHDGSRPWQPLEVVSAFAEHLIAISRQRGKKVCFQLIGGEVTLIRGLSSLLSRISELGGQVGLISNGSRDLAWWKEVREHLDFAILTFHPEQGRAEHIRRVAQYLSETIRTHVNVAAPLFHFDESVRVAEMLERDCQDVSITLKPMLIDFGTELYPYTEAQMRTFRERQFKPVQTRALGSVRGEMIARWDDGSASQMPATAFLTRGMNRWAGWHCHAGMELLSIDESGNIFKGLCRQDGQIGHISSPDTFELPSAAALCTRPTCVCQTDIMVSRYNKSRVDATAS